MHSADSNPGDARQCFSDVLGSALSGRGQEEHPLKTFDDLDWAVIGRAVADRCVGEDASALAADLGVLPSGPSPARRRREIGEARTGLQRGAAPPLQGVRAVESPLLRARKHEVLNADALVAVAKTAAAAERVRRWFAQSGRSFPLLSEHGERMHDIAEVAAIEQSFDPGGDLRDDASKELGAMRRRVRSLRDGLVARLERMAGSTRYEGILQDDYVTMREGRYVLPVRAGEKGDFPGIVHGQSASGQTLFIEPEELMDSNNKLRMAQLDVENEERRIFTRLSDVVRRRADHVEECRDVLTYVDLSFAVARLAEEISAHAPEEGEPGGVGALHLRDARHPVLAVRSLTEGFDVVPNEIALTESSHALIVSGPNAGGKTVTLKTLGLFALMMRAGMPVPCGPGSRFPRFGAVYTDVGDEQGVERDLSTFSGHVRNVARFLPLCGPTSLVLLDELFAGTDPEQGAALGKALLGALADRGTTVVVTTHLEGLKTLAFEDPRFAAASVGFDIEDLSPTYRLRAGVPGSSYALRIARRLGLDPAVIDRAEEIARGDAFVEREQLIERLESAVAAAEAQRDETARLEAEARSAAERAQRRHEQLAERDRKMVDEEAGRLRAEIQRLRGILKRWSRRFHGAEVPTEPDARRAAARELEEARREVDAAAAAVVAARQDDHEAEAHARTLIDPATLSVGDTVWAAPFGRSGQVVEVDGERGRAVVQLGPLKSNVDLTDLFHPSATENASPSPAPSTVDVVKSETGRERIDVRGARVDEALERLEAFVDRLARSRGSLVVVHGHGTGALKRAVRDHLAGLPYRIDWRPGERGEGGDGVTVVSVV